MKKLAFILISLLSSISMDAQQTSPCSTDELMKIFLDANPNIKTDFLRRQQVAKRQDSLAFLNGYASSQNKTAATVYTVPIVFHILHQYGPENISDAQVIDAVNILNRDYSKANADTAGVVNPFKTNIAKINFEFRLATIDPSGNCTTGITRHDDPKTNWPVSFSGADYTYTWPPTKYLNVYVVKSIGNGSAGYTFLPGSVSGNADAIVIRNDYIGAMGTSNPYTSRALTHEVGHWFNLSHVWGNTNSAGVTCGDDGVTDTPQTKGWPYCPPSSLFSQVCAGGVIENYQNYMDYSFCTCMFTNGQATRMTNAILSTVGGRNNIWSNANLIATGIISPMAPCAPKADFTSSKLECVGNGIVFADYSYNGIPTAWQWQFPGGTPSTASVQNPTVSYLSSGTKTITLKVSNAQGADSIIKSTVTILPGPGSGTTSLVESFETMSFPNSKWLKSTPKYAAGWLQNTSTGATGTNCLYIDNYFDAPNEPALIYTPMYNFFGLIGPTLTFKLAYAQKTSSNNDRLRVYSSKDCGASWTLNYSSAGTGLHTIGTGSFTISPFLNPSASQWRTESVSLTPLTATNQSVFLKFEFTSDSVNPGNNILIDDINIVSTVGIKTYSLDKAFISVYPNPLTNTANINFSLTERNNVKIDLFEITGKKVKQIVDRELDKGDYNYILETENTLAKGIYFLKFKIGDGTSTKKVIIE